MKFQIQDTGWSRFTKGGLLVIWMLLVQMHPVLSMDGDLPGWLPPDFPAVENIDEALCVRFFLTPEQARSSLDAALEAFPEREDWDAYMKLVRRKIREGAGLMPWPERTPLNPMVTGRRDYPGYSVMNVAFESIPGYWVTGNLYVPEKVTGRVPAILHTHGHSPGPDGDKGWAGHGRFKADVQYRAAMLAMMGSVSLTIDMFGYGDSIAQLGMGAHRDRIAMPMQIWNAMRSLDYLQSLDMVDPERIGVTGHSGGGTQAFLLTALDDRISVSVPVAMVSARFFGGCLCESGRPIHLSREHFVNNAMIAAMAVPRPMLVVSDGGDWTDQVPQVEFPFIAEIYRRYEAAEQVENVHLPNEGHNYGLSKRLAMYPFMASHLGLDLGAVLDETGQVDESAVHIEEPAAMRVFNARHPVPDNALKSAREIERVLAGKGLRPFDLKCDGMHNPLGVDSTAPRLSWKLDSLDRNKIQTAWQVQVAGNMEILESGKGCLWDSGKVSGAEQFDIEYAGPELGTSDCVYWRVRSWDESDEAGPWSSPASWSIGIVQPSDWKAEWMTHPGQLQFNREHLGYRSEPAQSVDTPKWIQLDLGKPSPIDEVVLRGVRHTVAERLGFPMEFLLEASLDEGFSKPEILMDCRDDPQNQWFTSHRIDGDGVFARYVRLTAPVLRDVNGEICLALSQIEVISNGKNIAPGAVVTASDSLETERWSAAAVVDGRDVPGYNPVENQTIVLRKLFTLDEEPEQVLAHVTGLGHYVLKINGKRIGKNKLSPGWTEYDKTVLYDTFDVTGLLHAGDNVVEILLAGGMYSVPNPHGRYTKFIGRFRPLRALFQMDLLDRVGTRSQIVSDSTWVARRGAITYSHMYGGEDYDLREEIAPNWEETTPRNGWVPAATIEEPVDILAGSPSTAPPIRAIDHLMPESITPVADGLEIYDLGQNVSIIPLIIAKGASGSRIRIIPAELIGPDGRVDRGSCGGGRPAWWELVLDGRQEPFTWEPEFFYHGARYLQVERIPAKEGGAYPEVLDLHGLVTHSSAESAGKFSCSSDLFTRTRELIRWAQRSNMVSVLTDCPHRERLGWLEQYHLNGPSLRYEFNLDKLFRKTFQDMSDAQQESGLVPNISPEYIVFDGAFRDSPEWGSAIILAAWQQYVYSGDVSVLENHYEKMVRYMQYLESRESEDGLIYHGLSDWYDLGPERPGFGQLTPQGITASATYFECARKMKDISTLLGKQRQAAIYQRLSERLKDSFNNAFLNRDEGYYGTNSQTANAMAYYLDLVPDDLSEKVLGSLIENIRENGNAITSGDVGHVYLLRALSKANRHDVIYDLHHQVDRPGYGYQLKMGATSLTESWDANRHSSQNHFMLGHILEWFYESLLGIQPDETEPGFKHVIIRPNPCGEITWARGQHRSRYGILTLDWKRSEELFQISVEIPVNTRATILLPATKSARLYSLADGEEREIPATYGDGRIVVEAGSGAYVFEVREAI